MDIMSGVQCWRLTASLKQSQRQLPSQGSASGYLGQPATKTDRQGCESLLKATKLVVDTTNIYSDNGISGI